jgi:hypothetical protein
MPTDIDTLISACIQARNAAANPLVFSDDATQKANNRTRGQFSQSIPQIPGGVPAVQTAVLNAASLFGALAKTIALFHNPNASVISSDDAEIARAAMESACRFKVANIAGKDPNDVDVSDGLVCA